MTTILQRMIVAVVLLAWSQVASAQTVDEVIEKHLTAIGGRAALAKLQSRHMTGTMTLSTPAGDVIGSIDVLNTSPNKARTLIKLDLTALGAGPIQIDQRFDGSSGYLLDSMQGDRPITGSQLENMKSAAFPTAFLNYQERGATVVLKGKEKVGDREAYLLVFTPKDGAAVRQYVDAESYLPVRMVATVEVPGMGVVDQISDLLDHRDVDGVKVPFTVKSSSAAQSFTITVTRVEHNVKVDETLFVKPGGDR
jgi:outer membrane lipoprotein-sorting protein